MAQLRRAFENEAARFLDGLARGESDLDWLSVGELTVPALAVTLYFRAPKTDYAEGVTACLESFLAEWGEQVAWYADEDLGRFRPATVKRLRRPIERLRDRSKPMPFYAWTMSAGESFESPSALSFLSHVGDDESQGLSFIRASFPIEAYAGAGGSARFVAMASEWAARLPLVHGYGGLTLNQSPSDGQRRSWILPVISRRFPGFEIDDCGGTALRGSDAIKGVNWLTFVGERFLSRVGGVRSLGSSLSASIEVVPMAARGAMLRAGDEPQRGDLLRDDRLPLYREVARALEPLRMKVHPPLGPEECGSFGPAGTALWLRRFD